VDEVLGSRGPCGQDGGGGDGLLALQVSVPDVCCEVAIATSRLPCPSVVARVARRRSQRFVRLVVVARHGAAEERVGMRDGGRFERCRGGSCLE